MVRKRYFLPNSESLLCLHYSPRTLVEESKSRLKFVRLIIDLSSAQVNGVHLVMHTIFDTAILSINHVDYFVVFGIYKSR
jgi:hypothetical protein